MGSSRLGATVLYEGMNTSMCMRILMLAYIHAHMLIEIARRGRFPCDINHTAAEKLSERMPEA